ncbi:ThiF family adenylyltransferase [Nostoc sp. CHAB 5834]|nr:ThiF family adenylyltransferase [Nostoc sp. CHAB 5834]
MRLQSFPDRELKLRQIYQVIPVSESEVLLFSTKEKSLQLNYIGSLLLPIVKYLIQGTSWRKLQVSPESRNPQWLETVDKVITALATCGALAHFVDKPDDLSVSECERFKHQLDYFSKYEDQNLSRFDYLRKLRKAHVLMLGLGSLGSSTLQHFVSAGIGQITGIDMDRVEIQNLTRSVAFSESDVEQTKIDVAKRIVIGSSRFTSYQGIFQEIKDENTISDILSAIEPVDLVLLTADTPIWKISIWAAEACRKHGVALIRGNRFGVGPLTIPHKSACPACSWPRTLDEHPEAAQLVEHQRKFGGSPAGVMSPVIGMTSAILAQESIAFLSGAGDVHVINTRLSVDIEKNPSLLVIPFPMDKRCAVCGSMENMNAG